MTSARAVTRWHSLSDALRARAEAFFGVDLSRVRVRLDEGLGAGVAAMARGDDIHLWPGVALWPRGEVEALLGHELAHVIQQRQGRARARRVDGGIAIDDDPALEREAEVLGERFAAGGAERLGLVAPPSVAPARRVAQRAVYVCNAPLRSVDKLNDATRACLALIPSATEWLAWAIDDTTQVVSFPDEIQLVDGTLAGLHGTSLMELPHVGLLASPKKLMTLPPQSLNTLLSAERGDASSVVEVQTRKILSDEQLVTASDLAMGDQFLSETGVAEAPVFADMPLSYRIAIFDLVRASQSEVAMQSSLQKEAASFAVGQAISALEFVDYYKSYMTMAAKMGALDGTADDRGKIAQAAVATLTPCLFRVLQCPEIGGFPSPERVQRTVQVFQGTGRYVGFERLSGGIAQIIINSQFKDQTGEAAQALVSGFVAEANAFFGSVRPATPVLSQDGASIVYPVETDSRKGELMVARNQLTLRSLRAKEKPAAANAKENANAPSTKAVNTNAPPAYQPANAAPAGGAAPERSVPAAPATPSTTEAGR